MELQTKTKEVYKEMSEIAIKEGYYLIPKSYYERMFNLIDSQKIEIKRLMDSRDNWKGKLKESKK